MNLKGFAKGYDIILTKTDFLGLIQNLGERKKILQPSYFNSFLFLKVFCEALFDGGQVVREKKRS